MYVTRIVKLADGEELVSFESVEDYRAEDDPRTELLQRRQAAMGSDPGARPARSAV